MKTTLQWLKDFVDISINPMDMGDLLTSLGLEVASIKKRQVPAGIKVAKVLTVDIHPNATKLHICSVDVGEQTPLSIVCGAPNVAAGMIVPCATIGTKFSSDFTITKAKLRGVESFGMLCSEKELGLSDDNSGLLSLPPTMTIGKELSAYYPDDYLIEVELTPNRGDCLSVLGIAREVAAKLGNPLKDTSIAPQESASDTIHNHISVTTETADACPRYLGRLVKNVSIGPSPDWMIQRLKDAGVRPINNVVDITNYIMLHFGQPMHAFDYASIGQKKIIVRKAGSPQSFATLDQVERKLVDTDLLICDGNGPVALAGIMGGAGSQINDTTKDVFLECAYFDPAQVRKTSKRLQLSTESSYRFERGVDSLDALVWAIDTAAEFLRQYAGGTVIQGRIDVHPSPIKQKTISIRTSRVKRLLGVDISQKDIMTTLTRLQFGCNSVNNDTLECTVPAYRHDMFCEADLIEEVGRFYGYDNIPSADYAKVSLNAKPSFFETRLDALRSSLAFTGLNEIMTNSLTSDKKNKLVAPATASVALLNPLSPDMAQMRSSLLSSALEVVAYNTNRKNNDNRYFECGRIYETVQGQVLPVEKEMASIVLSGDFYAKAWNNPAGTKADLYVLKGIINTLCGISGGKQFTFTSTTADWCTADGCVAFDNGVLRGTMGIVKNDICAGFDIKQTVLFAELDLTLFLSQQLKQVVFSSLPKYPALERDFCFVLSETHTAQSLASEIQSVSPLVESVTPFDVYRGEKLGAGLKSIAFSVSLRSLEKTLTDKEAEDICSKILAIVEQKFSATLRK